MEDAFRVDLASLVETVNRIQSMVPPDQTQVVEFDDGFQRPTIFGSDYVHYFANYKIVISQADLLDITGMLFHSIENGTFNRHQDSFRYLISMLGQRVRHLAAGTPYTLISLGGDCLPRSIPTKWGRKPPRRLGEPSMPFDLAVHPPESVAKILENSFEDYLSREHLRFETAQNCPMHARYDIIWNHETGHEWHANGWEKFLTRYGNRISNFRSKLTDGTKTVVLMYFDTSFRDHEVGIAYRIAHAVTRMSTNPLAFVCVASSRNTVLGSGKGPVRTEWVGKSPLFFFAVPVPFEGYLWWSHEHFTRPEGLEFDLRVIDAVDYAGRYLDERYRAS